MKTLCIVRHAASLATLLCALMLPSSGGCAAQEQGQGRPSAPGVPSVQWKLGAEAQATYAYLLYEQALAQGDEKALIAALNDLVPHRPPVTVYLESAVLLLGRNAPQAMNILQRGLKIFPFNTSINLLYAETLSNSGKPGKAVEHMRAFLRAHPGNVDGTLELALLLVKNDRHAEARELLHTITGDKRTALVEYYHARALIGMGRENEAMAHLRKALELSPTFVEAMAELAFIHEQRNELPEARTLYAAMLVHSGTHQDVLLRLIALSLRLDDIDSVRQYLEQGTDTLSFKLTSAGLLVESRQFLLAEPLLRSLLSAPIVPPEVYLYLAAICYEEYKDKEEALALLQKIPSGATAYARAVMLSAQILAETDKSAQALDVLRQGQQAHPEQRDLWHMEVRMLAGQKRLPEALALASRIAGRWPDDAALAFLHASLLEETGDSKGALAAMERIIIKHPNHFQALNYIGYTLADANKDIPRALALLHRALALAPHADYILDSLAWAQYRAGKFEDAWKNIQEAVAQSEAPDAVIWEHFGDIAKALGKKDEARKGYQKALETNPPNAQSLKERLSKL